MSRYALVAIGREQKSLGRTGMTRRVWTVTRPTTPQKLVGTKTNSLLGNKKWPHRELPTNRASNSKTTVTLIYRLTLGLIPHFVGTIVPANKREHEHERERVGVRKNKLSVGLRGFKFVEDSDQAGGLKRNQP